MSSQWVTVFKYLANMEPDRVRIDADDVMLRVGEEWQPAHGKGATEDSIIDAIHARGWDIVFRRELTGLYIVLLNLKPYKRITSAPINFYRDDFADVLLNLYISALEDIYPQPWLKNNIDNHIAYYENQLEYWPESPHSNDLRQFIIDLRKQKQSL